ncbi:MAG: CoB--CoM heterodisulfide reductase iron-sulfur subunit A family protein [Deltaproteobacteria bacterium]|nr:CoB--CoM heterodisulfide reductase iron-sulfur subunit A family protein [Deltaproteobacteria bacterium]
MGVPPKETEHRVTPAALVIGGGIAGMQASLDIADKGFKVVLVEREPTIGGHMAQLDKTFPTLDCSSCILTPKMVEVGNHPNIELLTCAEVTRVEGEVGRFRVTITKKPRYVDLKRCTGCGLCAEACVQHNRIPNEFDMGMGKRSAIYIPFPQAVPQKYLIDPNRCFMLTKGKCGKQPRCQEACGPGAIDFGQKEETLTIRAGVIVVATGYDQFDGRLKPEYGYGLYENVLSAIEFERLCSASGPTRGRLERNGKEPKRVVFIQCVGSRDRTVGNPYCSRVCCMYTAKQAHLVRELIPDAKITVCYMDVRAYGKGYEEFYDRVQKEGVVFRRGNPSEIYREGDCLVVRGEDTLLGMPYEEKADLVVLANGLVPRADAQDLGLLLGISHTEDGFFEEAETKETILTARPGVFLAGCCQGPKDIPDTVAQASGAAALSCIHLAEQRAGAEGPKANRGGPQQYARDRHGAPE